jgi:RND family efflux transporter MFP subunit
MKKLLNIIAGLIILLFWGCNKQQESGKKTENTTAVPVKTTYVYEEKIAFPVRSSGMLCSKQEINLSFKTGGIIEHIYVREGQSVTKGQVLATLNLSEVKAKVTQANLEREKAERDYRRAEKLYADTVITLEQLQDLKTAFEVAQANSNIANFNLKYSVITSPSNGKVLKKLLETNEMVNPGIPVFQIGCTEGDWIVKAIVSDKNILDISYHDSAHIYFDAYPEKIFNAKVSEISNAADPGSGTFKVELTVDRNGKKLISGLIANAIIYPSKTKKVVTVPVNSIIEGDGTAAYIYKIKSGYPVKTKISVYKLSGDNMYVTDGIQNGSEVIIEGFINISENSPIKRLGS